MPDSSKEFLYEKGEWRYRDRYFGFNPFIGEEVVWRQNKAVWEMNYCGKILTPAVDAEEIYEFLRDAMRKVNKSKPFRGPSNYKRGNFTYKNHAVGNKEFFIGKEEIFFQNKKVYELNYHGGIIK